MSNNISRLNFLKLLGLGASIFMVGGFGGISNLVTTPKSQKPAYAQQSGSWSLGQDITTPAIHIALLTSGKVFYLAGSGFDNARQFGPFDARILDVNTGSETTLTQTEDLFCIGLTSLADGKVLMAGGTLRYNGNPDNCNGEWHGLKSAYELDSNSESMTKVTSMAHGRWYPTLVTLPDGKVWCCGGDDEYGIQNRLVEVYDPGPKSWTRIPDPGSTRTYCVGAGYESTCPGAGSPCYNNASPTLSFYPRTHLMPNGQLVICGFRRNIFSWNPANGRFTELALSSMTRDYGTSFLYPLHNTSSEKGKILLVGGSPSNSDPAVTSVEVLDFDASSSSVPVIRNVSPIAHRRKFPNPVILPDGKLVIFAGHENVGGIKVLIPEMFDPVTESWQDLPAASVFRNYHGVALLLPDGRVWNAGSAPIKGVWERRTEFFSPGYLFAGTRPTISGAPTVGDYGGTINVPTPEASEIESVSLVRLMATTHHYDANQRLVWLQITNRGSSSITVSAPINPNIAPPGYYMIHVLNASGVPSVARIIKIPGTGGGGGDTTPPSQVTGLSASAAGSTQINLAWTANPTGDGVSNYNVYRGTTAGFTVTPGTTAPTATPTTNSYSNTGLTASTTYYYKVAAVDAAGNIGPLSSEASATTSSAPADTIAPSVRITSPAEGSSLPAGTIAVQGTSFDETGGSGIRDVQTKINISGTYTMATPVAPGNWSTWSNSHTITAPGAYKVIAKATDNAGNTRNYTVNITVS